MNTSYRNISDVRFGRLIAKRVHTIDNVVVCCSRCNRCKSDQFTYEEWVEMGKCIRAMRKQMALAAAGSQQ